MKKNILIVSVTTIFLGVLLYNESIKVKVNFIDKNKKELIKSYKDKKFLYLINNHTKEKYKGVYFENGKYKEDELLKINYLLRDHRSNQICSIDIKLIDIIEEIQKKLNDYPFYIVSGFRNENSNKIVGGKKRSQHLKCKAIDIQGADYNKIYNEAIKIKDLGVGKYNSKKFIHIDTRGKKARW